MLHLTPSEYFSLVYPGKILGDPTQKSKLLGGVVGKNQNYGGMGSNMGGGMYPTRICSPGSYCTSYKLGVPNFGLKKPQITEVRLY